MMAWLDLAWIPLVAMSLAASAGAAVAYIRLLWRNPAARFAYARLPLSVLTAVWVFMVLRCEVWLFERFFAALQAIL